MIGYRGICESSLCVEWSVNSPNDLQHSICVPNGSSKWNSYPGKVGNAHPHVNRWILACRDNQLVDFSRRTLSAGVQKAINSNQKHDSHCFGRGIVSWSWTWKVADVVWGSCFYTQPESLMEPTPHCWKRKLVGSPTEVKILLVDDESSKGRDLNIPVGHLLSIFHIVRNTRIFEIPPWHENLNTEFSSSAHFSQIMGDLFALLASRFSFLMNSQGITRPRMNAEALCYVPFRDF